MFCDLFSDSIAEELYDVELAGLQFSVEATNTALVIKVTGYNDKLPVLTTKMLGELRDFSPTAERFASVKDQVGRFLTTHGLSLTFDIPSWLAPGSALNIKSLTRWRPTLPSMRCRNGRSPLWRNLRNCRVS